MGGAIKNERKNEWMDGAIKNNERMNEGVLYLAAYVLIVQLSQGPLVSSHKGIQARPCQGRLGSYISICTPPNHLVSQQCMLLVIMGSVRQCCSMISQIIGRLQR